MKFILLFLISLIYTTKAYFLTEPIQNCSALTGQWQGIWTFMIPQNQQYCLYTTSIDSPITADQEWNIKYTNKIIRDTGACGQLEDLFESKCLYNNGYIKQINTNTLKLQGQGQTDLVMLNAFSGYNYNQYKTWQMVKQVEPAQQTRFQTTMLSTIENFNKSGFQGGNCQNLSGNWYGQGIYQAQDQNNNAIYELIANIESTATQAHFTYKSTGINISGEQGGEYDQEVIRSFTINCDSQNSIFINDNFSVTGFFTDDVIFMDAKYKERIQFKNYVFFRDE